MPKEDLLKCRVEKEFGDAVRQAAAERNQTVSDVLRSALGNPFQNAFAHARQNVRVRKSQTVDGYGVVQDPPSAGNRQVPHSSGGKFESSATSGGTADPFARQQNASSADGKQPGDNFDTEQSRTRGPGTAQVAATGGFEQALERTQQNVASYALHAVNPRVHMKVGQNVRSTVTQYTDDGQPIATDHFNPATTPCPEDCNPYVYRQLMAKIHALTATFKQNLGRYPVTGEPLSADDRGYMQAVQDIIDEVYGPNAQAGTWIQ